MRALQASWLAVAVSGCTVALPYPGVEQEICDNHVDDDFDDEVDCDDDGCDGECPEDDATSCTDGRDDDRDGLFDFADPGCWPLAHVEITSCGSAPGTDARFDFDGTDERWAFSDGAHAADPTGSVSHPVFVVGPDDSGRADQIDVSTGRLVGMSLIARLHLDPVASRVSVELDVRDAPVDVSRITVSLGSGRLSLEALTTDSAMLTATEEGWYEVTLDVVDLGTLHAEVRHGGVVVAQTTEDIPTGSWSPSQMLGVRLRGYTGAASPPLVVTEMTLHRDPFTTPCGAVVPALEPLVGLFFFGLRAVSMQGDGSLCAVGDSFVDERGESYVPPVPALARSGDGGLTWALDAHEELADPPDPFHSLRFEGSSLSGDVLHTLLWRAASPSQVGVLDGCSTYRAIGDVPLGADIEARGYAFDGTDHEIFAVQGDRIVRRRFATGDVHFTSSDVLARVDPDAIGRITRVGSDLVVTGGGGPTPGLFVVSSGPRHHDALRPLHPIGGSGLSGACDEYEARGPVLAMDPRPVVTDAAATGTVLVTCAGRTTLGGQLAGHVPRRFVVRAP